MEATDFYTFIFFNVARLPMPLLASPVIFSVHSRGSCISDNERSLDSRASHHGPSSLQGPLWILAAGLFLSHLLPFLILHAGGVFHRTGEGAPAMCTGSVKDPKRP